MKQKTLIPLVCSHPPTKIDYAISIDRAFLGFAYECGVKPEKLFKQSEKAILTQHHTAIPDKTPNGGIRPGVWCLDFGPACVIYAVSGETAYIGEYLCNANGQSYEPSQDLLAGMS